MASQTFDNIIKELTKKVYHPVYFLQGDEPYFIDRIESYIEQHVLSDIEKEFNQTVLYGRDVDVATIISTAKRYPMMANYQVVIVREAQDVKDLLKSKSESDNDGDGEQNQLSDYLSNPQPTTVLVFCYKNKKVDKRTKVGKLIEKNAVFFDSKKIYDDKLPAWISSYISHKGKKINPDASLLLAEYLGNDLNKVANELDKLLINVREGDIITNLQIENDIGISKDFNVFELQNAIGVKNVLKAQRIVNYFGSNPKPNPIILTLSTLNQFFTKLITYHVFKNNKKVNLSSVMGINHFFLKDFHLAARNFSLSESIKAISLLHEYDTRSKGVGSSNISDHDLLRELVFKLLHPDTVPA